MRSNTKIFHGVNASSSSVYGDNPELPKHEGMMPNPLSPYAVSKLGGENTARYFHGAYKYNIRLGIFFTIFS